MSEPRFRDPDGIIDPPGNVNNPLLRAALEYLKEGISVIPLVPGGKKPWINWRQFETRRPTPEEVVGWWTERPSSNIGGVTGAVSGFIVIDLDPYKVDPASGGAGGGIDVANLLRKYPTGRVVRTGGNGFHFWYAAPPRPVRNRVGQDGIDVRGDGGFVVLPPSAHASGRLYRWERREALGPPPDFLLEELARVAGDGDPGSDQNMAPWITDLLENGAREGARNDSSARLAGYLAGKGIPYDVAELMLLQQNQRNSPPMPEQEVITTARSIYAGHASRLVNGSRPGDPHVSNFVPGPGITGHGRFRVFSIDHYMARYGEESVSWTVPEWLPESTVALVVSPPGSFKTWLLLDLAVSVATGTPFLGIYPMGEGSSPQSVLIIQQEDYHGQTAERLAIMIRQKLNLREPGGGDEEGDGDDTFQVSSPPHIPIYLHPDRLLRFEDKNLIADLRQVIIAHGIKLVIIDPLYSAASTDEYMAKSAEQMLALKKIRDELGVSFVIAHHTKKGADGEAEREQAWGSQFLNAFLETGWQVRPGVLPPNSSTGPRILITRHFKTRPNIDKQEFEFRISTNPPYLYEVVTHVSTTQREEDIVGWLIQNGPHTKTEIAAGTGLNRSTVSRRVDALVTDGLVAPTARPGRYAAVPRITMQENE